MTVCIQTGYSEEQQESSFMNATLQGAGAVAFSIATHITVPDDVSAQGEACVANYLRDALTAATQAAAEYGLKFHAQVGAARGYESDN